ncbi:MAG: ATP-binding protein [Lachnospiraceae bacterium]
MTKFFKKYRLAFLFVLLVFVIMLLANFLMMIFVGYLRNHGVRFFDTPPNGFHLLPLISQTAISIILGCVISFIVSFWPIGVIRKTIKAIDRLADGDYSAQLELKGGMEEIENLTQSFNHLAKELSSVELLKTDFVNNFSHEFKTPIVSIRGYAKLLKYDDLTSEDEGAYLDIIIQESDRLSLLAENVLRLSKLKKQIFLEHKESVNLTEQIRLAAVVLAKKWEKKNLFLSISETDSYVTGNAELLKQVWINLLDNAIKFSPLNGTIEILVQETADTTICQISNECQSMDPDSLPFLFDKFYQADTSHATEGTGLGLSLVTEILKLHQGTISVELNSMDRITFSILLPK